MVVSSPLVFIASPVSHAQPDVVAVRVKEAARFAAWVMENEGKNVYPAAVCDMALAPYMVHRKTSEWWFENMKVFMEPAEACYVLQLEGWDDSRGVALEIECARNVGTPIFYYQPMQDGYLRT